MLAKITALVQSKIALAVLGVALVGGGGTAVAVAATGGHLLPKSTPATTSVATHTTHSTETPGARAHTVSVEGTLTACDTTANTLGVTDAQGKAWIFTVNTQTRYNGAENATTQAAVCATANINTRKVEVSATQQSDGSYLAWKVTLQGTVNGNGSHGSGQGGSANGKAQNIEGSIVAVDTTAMTLTVKQQDGTTVTITITAQTTFSGAAHSLADLKSGERVHIQGQTQSDGSVIATSVTLEGGA